MLGPYELRGELGRGAMAVVWRAWDTRLEREVAIKEPLTMQVAGESISTEFAERFVREGRAAAGLNHPGIVTIYNADVYDGRPVIVMELIEGDVLSDVAARGPAPAGFAVSVADQLLDALGYAHSRGVVHRDIKPDNVFVLPDGRVKISDFGIAHVESSATLTQAGSVMGTPGYMAPEQVTGSPVDARTDLFAVGVITYELLTGSNPFGSTVDTTPTAIMFRVVQYEPPELGELAGFGVDPHLSETVRVAMAKDPAYRFASADSMRRALRGEPIETAASTGVSSSAPTVVGAPSPFPVAARTAAVPPPTGSVTNRGAIVAVAAVAGVAVLGAVLVGALRAPRTVAGGAGAPASVAASPTVTPAAAQPVEPEPEPVAPEPQVVDLAEAEDDVRDFVEEWRSDWENERLSAFLDHYDRNSFYAAYKRNGEGANYSSWAKYHRGSFAKYDITAVSLDDVSIDISADGLSATVSFEQYWQTSTYWDQGPKTLELEKHDGRWWIVNEEWSESSSS